MPAPSLPADVLEWVAAAIGSGARATIVGSKRGASGGVDFVDVVDAGGRRHRVVLRRYTDGRLGDDPCYDPAREVAALRILEGTDVHAPRLVAADVTRSVGGAPLVLVTRLPGRSPVRPRDMARFMEELARELVTVHTLEVPVTVALPPYERYYDAGEIRGVEWSERPALWERALRETETLPDTPVCFIHRDYHQHNTLFSGGRLTGVVDWLTACRGPVAIDLARMRQNLAYDFGPPWPDRFLARYRELAPEPVFDLRAWELVDLLDGLVDSEAPVTRAERRRRRWLEDHLAAILAGR